MPKLFVAIFIAGIILLIYACPSGEEKENKGHGWLTKEINSVGVYPGYEPEQPIKFSHAIHSEINEIDCQYCHSSASKGKHAGIPSVNVCMNCHKGIQRNDTISAEIAKIFEAAGFDQEAKTYSKKKHPIKWNKVHSLPDQVYFPHAQHANIPELTCQSCHGNANSFDSLAFIHATKLDSSRKYYDEIHKRLLEKSDYGKYLSDNQRQATTVNELGGFQCSKCHY
jgi:nitrate/TMAO reductase-like tetraheme cytochrome c subunit